MQPAVVEAPHAVQQSGQRSQVADVAVDCAAVVAVVVDLAAADSCLVSLLAAVVGLAAHTAVGASARHLCVHAVGLLHVPGGRRVFLQMQHMKIHTDHM